jgi:hypothetical protein
MLEAANVVEVVCRWVVAIHATSQINMAISPLLITRRTLLGWMIYAV